MKKFSRKAYFLLVGIVLFSVCTGQVYAAFSTTADMTQNTFASAASFSPSITPTPIESGPTPTITETPTPTPTTQPSFACPDVSAPVKVFYATGLHWIIGNPVLQSGSDKVFSLGNDKYTQCYCPTVGTSGIQTEWLPAGNLTQSQINDYLSQGYLHVANGKDFDLAAQPYVAKNTPFTCATPAL